MEYVNVALGLVAFIIYFRWQLFNPKRHPRLYLRLAPLFMLVLIILVTAIALNSVETARYLFPLLVILIAFAIASGFLFRPRSRG